MKTYRMIAALLAIVMLLGVFAGCSKNSDNTLPIPVPVPEQKPKRTTKRRPAPASTLIRRNFFRFPTTFSM